MMDILKRIDFVQQFAKEYADGAWSIDADKWRHHVTPELIEDVRQYIVSLQIKLMHEQTAQAKSPAWHDAPNAPWLWMSRLNGTLRNLDVHDIEHLAKYGHSGKWFGPIPEDA